MRRLGVVLLLVAATLIVVAPPAYAHLCPSGMEIPAGTPTNLTVYVRVEGIPVPDVEVEVPGTLHVNGVEPPKNWTFTRAGQTVRLRGPAFPEYKCPSFTINVTATAKGAYQVVVAERDAKGALLIRSTTDPTKKNDQNYAQLVYAGVKAPSPSSGGPSGLTLAGIALVALGVVGAAVMAWRSRRARREDDDEHAVQDRVDAFKEQTRARRSEQSSH